MPFQMIGIKAELRVVERSAHRQVDLDDAALVLQQRNAELDRDRRGVLGFGLVAELQVVDDDVALRVELAVFHAILQGWVDSLPLLML